MSNLYLRELDPPTHLQQFDANCGKIRYVSDPLAKLNILHMYLFSEMLNISMKTKILLNFLLLRMSYSLIVFFVKSLQS